MKKNILNETFKKHLNLLHKKLVNEGVIPDEYETTLEREDPATGELNNVNVVVHYTATGGYVGSYHNAPEPVEVNIVKVVDSENGETLKLSPEEEDELIEKTQVYHKDNM